MTGLSAFPLPFTASRSISFAKPRTLRELEIMQCSAHLRAKPGWFDKMNDADIVARWTQEALAQGLTEAQVRYVFAELEHYAALRDGRTGIEVSAVDGVWQSDALVDDKLRFRLREAVRVLEEVPEEEQDWHPGSDGQVLDLVHPSMFCLVREASGAPERAWQNPTTRYSKYEFSERFQWLPTDVDVSDDGDVAFRSYINNVHPETHHELASVLPDLFARMVPLWEKVLTDLRHPRPLRIEADPYGWYDSEPEYPDKSSYSDPTAHRKPSMRGNPPTKNGGRTAARSSRRPRSSPCPRRPTHPPGSTCVAVAFRSSSSSPPFTSPRTSPSTPAAPGTSRAC